MFKDPNDMCQVLLLGIVCCLARASLARGWAFSILWLLPIGLFSYAVLLTHSRGGLLGILAAIAGIVYLRVGRRAGLLLAPAVIALGIIAAGGRQAQLSVGANDTSHERMQVWAEALGIYFQRPFYFLTGIGTGAIEDELGLVAHNSFVQAFIETGIIGGSLFSCLVVVPLLAIARLSPPNAKATADAREIWQLRSYIFGLLLGFAIGCFSLTRNTAETSYVFIGIGACYLGLARKLCPPWLVLDYRFFKFILGIGVLLLVLLKFFTQFMTNL